MRGHSLLEMGQLQRGIALLEHANKQARGLGLTNNAYAVDSSIATYVIPGSSLMPRRSSASRRCCGGAPTASYSQRELLTEAAVQRALRGRRSEAVTRRSIAADRDALRGDTRRGKVASILVRIWLTRWQLGPASCRELVDQASELIEPRDVAFRAELLGFEILVARAREDDAERDQQAALAQLHTLWRTTQHFYAKAALGQFDMAAPRQRVRRGRGDPAPARAVTHHDHSALSRIVALGLHGVIPELLGLTPARRIILIPSEELLLLEDHGDVIVRQRPPRWWPLLLRILASGDSSARSASSRGCGGCAPTTPSCTIRRSAPRSTGCARSCSRSPTGSRGQRRAGYRTTVPVHLVSGPEVPVDRGSHRCGKRARFPLLEPRRGLRMAPRNDAVDVSAPSSWSTSGSTSSSRPPSPSWRARSSCRRAPCSARCARWSPSAGVECLGFARATRYRLRAATGDEVVDQRRRSRRRSSRRRAHPAEIGHT